MERQRKNLSSLHFTNIFPTWSGKKGKSTGFSLLLFCVRLVKSMWPQSFHLFVLEDSFYDYWWHILCLCSGLAGSFHISKSTFSISISSISSACVKHVRWSDFWSVEHGISTFRNALSILTANTSLYHLFNFIYLTTKPQTRQVRYLFWELQYHSTWET